MTRILLWCDGFSPLIGGVEVLAAKTVAALAARSYELMVIADRHANLAAESMYGTVPVRRLPFVASAISRDIEQWAALRQQVSAIKRDFRPSLVWVYHVNIDVMFHLATMAVHRAPMLCTVHGAFADGTLRADTAFGQALAAADWVTACSVAALDHTRRLMPEITPRSSVILNGLEMPRLEPRPLPFDEPRLLCVGRIGTVVEKGFDLALEALSRVRGRFPHARLSIAGDGAARPELERQARTLGIEGSVDFLGWVHPANVLALINDCTILLMPSRVPEGFGLVALQAAQMARPVVASRVGGVAEVVADGETGLLVNRDDADGLARAIETLLDDPARAAAMGRTGRRRAEMLFGWERHVDAYDELLRRLSPRSRSELVAG